MEAIFEHAQNMKELTEDMKVQYEKIEERIQRAIKETDKNCRIYKQKQVLFSTKQKRLMGAMIRVLQMARLNFLMTGSRNRLRARVVSRMANKYKYEGLLVYTTREEYDKKIKEAAKAYDEFRPKAQKFRETYLAQLAEEMAAEDGKEISHHLKQLINREKIRNHYRRIKQCEGRFRTGGVELRRMKAFNSYLKSWR